MSCYVHATEMYTEIAGDLVPGRKTTSLSTLTSVPGIASPVVSLHLLLAFSRSARQCCPRIKQVAAIALVNSYIVGRY